ncbi:MAG: hypothetical protein HZA15_01300 [Nitrospirae bacterium]|nr:hypothetical protein [Nitrospirota bacterium]
MTKEELEELLCAPYCSFYKPGKDEEPGCKGSVIFKNLFEEGKKVPVRTDRIVVSFETEDDLFQAVCRTCPFFEQDCDFAEWKRGDAVREALKPCGGFLCLGHCLDHGTIDIEDINRVI